MACAALSASCLTCSVASAEEASNWNGPGRVAVEGAGGAPLECSIFAQPTGPVAATGADGGTYSFTAAIIFGAHGSPTGLSTEHCTDFCPRMNAVKSASNCAGAIIRLLKGGG